MPTLQRCNLRHWVMPFKGQFAGFTWRLWYSVTLFGFMGVARGIEEALVAVMVVQNSFLKEFGLDTMPEDERAGITGNVVAMSQLGCIAGAISTLIIADRIGRIWWGRIMCALWLLGILLYTTSTGNLGQVYGGKFIVGLGLGQISVIAPAYIAECCVSENRGFAVAIFGATEYLGAIIGYFTSYGTATSISSSSSSQWKIPQITAAVFASVFLIMLTFALESPRILVKNGSVSEARDVLQKFRNATSNPRDIEQELVGIKRQLVLESECKDASFLKSVGNLFSTRRNLDRLCVTCAAHLLQVWSGASSITVYAPQYFEILGIRDQNERLLYTSIFGIVKLVASAACAAFAVDQIGRRRSLSIGITVQLTAISYVAAVLSVVPGLARGEDSSKNEAVGVSAIVFMYICGAGYAFGWNSISYLITSEIFSLQIRTVGTALVMILHYGSRYGLQKAVPLMTLQDSLGPAGTFWFFSGMTLVGLIWVWAWLPETGRMHLEKASLWANKEARDNPWGDGQPQDVGRKVERIQPGSSDRRARRNGLEADGNEGSGEEMAKTQRVAERI